MVKKPPKARANHSAHLSSKLSLSSKTLLTSAFSPSRFRLSLFASTILGLDAHRLRIHDFTTSKLCCETTLGNGVAINSLTWGTISPLVEEEEKKNSKKRKRNKGDGVSEAPTVIVAATTSISSVLLYSPTEGRTLATLEGGHLGEVKQFVFSDGKAQGKRGWSVGADGKLIEWDLRRKVAIRSINLPDASIQRLAYLPSSILCASHTIYAIDYENPETSEPPTFSASTTQIHTVIASGDKGHFLSAADSDRFINLFSLDEKRLTSALVAESDVRIVSVHKQDQAETLVAVTIDGVVELFKKPFSPGFVGDTSAPPRKRKALTRKADAMVKIARPASRQEVTIVDATLQDEDLIVAWVDAGVNVQFETLRCTNPEDGSLLLTGLVEIAKGKSVVIGGGAVNGSKEMEKYSVAVNQSQAVVVGGADMNDIDMEDAMDGEPSSAGDKKVRRDAGADCDFISSSDEEEREPEEPTFGERVQALESSNAAAKSASSTALAKTTTEVTGKQLQTPSAGSLATVLAQALRADDKSLLESCLHTSNLDVIGTTVRRLNSTLAVTLLERLAERLARRPGRAASLGAWVRMTLVAHGGYLVSLPDLMSTLSALHATIDTRAGSLPRLLELQGRLEMLNAQVDFRKSLGAGKSSKEEEDDEKVLYIEGQEEGGDSADEGSDEESDEEPEEVGVEQIQIEDASFIGESASSDEDAFGGIVDDDNQSGEDESDDDEDIDDGDEDDGDEDDGGISVDGFLDAEASEDNTADDDEDSEDGGDETDEASDEGDDGDSVNSGSNGSGNDDEAIIAKIRRAKAINRTKR